jgi:peptidoglycan hydrolase CwlO-like protein
MRLCKPRSSQGMSLPSRYSPLHAEIEALHAEIEVLHAENKAFQAQIQGVSSKQILPSNAEIKALQCQDRRDTVSSDIKALHAEIKALQPKIWHL